jgi:hypothetical protein
MTKTPEELAEEYAKDFYGNGEHLDFPDSQTFFLAGYQAAAPQWISTKDRLPEIGQWILVDGPEVVRLIEPPSSNWKSAYAWETDHESFYAFGDVSHWMPLPEPPKGEK